jgi:hypothetical protein
MLPLPSRSSFTQNIPRRNNNRLGSHPRANKRNIWANKKNANRITQAAFIDRAIQMLIAFIAAHNWRAHKREEHTSLGVALDKTNKLFLMERDRTNKKSTLQDIVGHFGVDAVFSDSPLNAPTMTRCLREDGQITPKTSFCLSREETATSPQHREHFYKSSQIPYGTMRSELPITNGAALCISLQGLS